MRRRLLGLTLLAACQETPAQVCFEAQSRQDERTCGYTQAELVDLGEELQPLFVSVCFSQDECPDACDADRIMSEVLEPALYEDVPTFELRRGEPLCREDDPATGECCYWGLFEGYVHPQG